MSGGVGQTTRDRRPARPGDDSPDAAPAVTWAPGHSAATFGRAPAQPGPLGAGAAATVRRLAARSAAASLPEATHDPDGALGPAADAALVHTDADAAEAAELLGAEAFTLGRDIFFSADAYRPGTAAGKALIRHELRHVAQNLGLAAGQPPVPPPAAPPVPLPVPPPVTPPAPPRTPPWAGAPLTLAAPDHPLERAARDGMPSRGPPHPGGLILRMPAHLPPTAGGQRLQRHLRPRGEENWQSLRDLVKAEDFDGIQRMDPWTRNPGEDIADRLRAPVPTVHSSASLVGDSAIRARILGDFRSDIATLVYENFYEDEDQEYDTFDWRVGAVETAYRNLVHLYLYEQQHPTAVSPYRSPLPSWFETRAKIFRNAAIQSHSPQLLYSTLSALAADVAAAAAGEVLGPEQSGKALVGSLFEDGISQDDLTAVGQLYRNVLRSLNLATMTAGTDEDIAGRVDEMADEFVPGYLEATVLDVEAALVRAADDDRIAEFRRRLGDEIGFYLATLAEDRFLEDTEAHLVALDQILRDFSAPDAVHVFLYYLWVPVTLGDEEEAEADTEAGTAQPQPAAQAPATTARAPTRPPPEPVCDGEDINHADITAWLKSYNTDRLSFFARWADIPGLICANRPYTDQPEAAAVRANLAAMTAEAVRVLDRLNRQTTAARLRADEIALARSGEEVCNLDDPASDEEARIEPEYISGLDVDNEFYYLFNDALTRHSDSFETLPTGDRIDLVFQQYFEELAYYQLSLKAAVLLWNELSQSTLDQYLRSRDEDRYGQILTDMQAYAEQTAEFPDWPLYASEVARGREIDLAVIRLQGITERARTESDIENVEELQSEIFFQVPVAVANVRTSRREANPDARPLDYVRRSDIWPDPLAGLLSDAWRSYETDTETIIDAALELANEARLRELAQTAARLAEAGDAMQSESVLERFTELESTIGRNLPAGARSGTDPGAAERDALFRRVMTETPSAQLVDAIRTVNVASTHHLLSLFMVAQPALDNVAGDPRGPGQVVRQMNLLAILVDQSRSKTLAGAMGELSDVFLPISIGTDPTLSQRFVQGSMLGLNDSVSSFASDNFRGFSSMTAMAGPHGAMIYEAVAALQRSSQSGALRYLLDAERAGGLRERAVVLAGLADELRRHGGNGFGNSQALVAARFIYADIIGVAQLIDPLGMPREVTEAQTRQNAGFTPNDPSGAARSGPVPTWQEDRETISQYETRQSNAFADLEAGIHPVTQEELTPFERSVFDRYQEITGSDHWHNIGPEDIDGAVEFFKQVAKMLTVMLLTRGIGSRVFASTGSRFLAATANIGAFTAVMRAEQTLSTGQYPHTSFLEDFIINLATEGVGQGTQMAYRGLFGIPRTATRIGARHAAGIFVAEMATTSIASVVAAGLSARYHGRSFTDAQLREAMVSNAAFMIAMRGAHIMGERATNHLSMRLADAQLEGRVLAVDLATLQREMQTQDAAILDASRTMLDQTTDAERSARLEEQLSAMQRKLAILERSADPEVRMLAESYRQGVEAHRRSVYQARLHIQINAREVPGSSNFTYDPGPMSERALTTHLADSGHPYTIREGLDGRIFEVTMPNGTRVRYRPRRPGAGGASRRGGFTDVGRLEGSELSASDPAALMDIILNDPLHHPSIEDTGTNSFLLQGEHFPIQITIEPVERFSEGTPRHEPGPATYDIRYNADTGRLEATIEVLTDKSNDHIVRGVNEEMHELSRLLTVIETDTGGTVSHLSGRAGARWLQQIVSREAAAGVLRRGTPGDRLTADDISTMRSIGFLGQRLAQLTDRINDPATPRSELDLLYARRGVVLSDFQNLWHEAGLPTDRAALQGVVDTFQAAGVPVDRATLGYLQGMRFTRAGHPSLGSPITMLDLHILFSELQKANPNRFGGVTLLDFINYYHDAVARRAKTLYDQAIAEGRTPREAADIQIDSILRLMGGTSIPSARGRAFEGFSVEDFNGNPTLVQQYGRMYGIERNNYPTYDAVTVTGAANGFTMREVTRTDPAGNDVQHLQLIAADGTMFFECHRGPNRALEITKHLPGYDVLMWSMKARNSLETFQVLRATGHTASAWARGRMFLSGEGATVLSQRVAWYQAEVARLQALGAHVHGHPQHGEFRLTRWRRDILARVETETQTGRTNRSIDALLEVLRVESLDPNEVEVIP